MTSALLVAVTGLAACGSVRPAPPSSTPTPSSGSPAQFVPVSASFVSATDGFVLGGIPQCTTGDCQGIRHTVDGGGQWTNVPAPGAGPYEAQEGPSGGGSGMVFANDLDGWIYGGQRIWSTHNGGATWNSVATSGSILGLVADDGQVYDLVSPCAPGYNPTCSSPDLLSASPISADQWTVVRAVDIPTSPGGTLRKSGPFILIAVGILEPPTPPLLWVFDSQTDHLVSGPTPLCNESSYPTTPDLTSVAGDGGNEVIAWCESDGGAGTAWLQPWYSSDDGMHFAKMGTEFDQAPVGRVVMASPTSVLFTLIEQAGLFRSDDSGATWSAPIEGLPADGPAVWMDDLDFVSPAFGYVIVDTSTPALYLSDDGGAHWQPVTIP